MPPIVEKGGITMTIIEAINRLDKIKPNGYGQEDKIEWLSEIDGIVKQTVTDTHEVSLFTAFELLFKSPAVEKVSSVGEFVSNCTIGLTPFFIGDNAEDIPYQYENSRGIVCKTNADNSDVWLLKNKAAALAKGVFGTNRLEWDFLPYMNGSKILFTDIEFTGYDATTPLDTVLLIPSPYDSAYLDWLSAKIDFADGEYARYNNSMTRFNDTFLAFSRFYNRKYMPKGAKFKYF